MKKITGVKKKLAGGMILMAVLSGCGQADVKKIDTSTDLVIEAETSETVKKNSLVAALAGKWRLASEKTEENLQEYDHNLQNMWGTGIHYGNEMEIGPDGSFRFYIGVNYGGEGTVEEENGRLAADTEPYAPEGTGGSPVQFEIVPVTENGIQYLTMECLGETLYWERLPEGWEGKIFTGIIKELYGSMALVAIDDGQDISGNQAFIRLNEEQQDMAKVEDRVRVTYDGLIQETDPLQIPNQIKVEFLQNSIENESDCQEKSIQVHRAEEYHSLKEFRIHSEEKVFVLRSDTGADIQDNGLAAGNYNHQGFSAVDGEVTVEESYISVKYDCTYQENSFDVWVFTERESYENGMMQELMQMAEGSQSGILDIGGKEPVSYGGLGKIYGNIFGYWAVLDQKPVIVHIKEGDIPYIELVLSHIRWE